MGGSSETIKITKPTYFVRLSPTKRASCSAKPCYLNKGESGSTLFLSSSVMLLTNLITEVHGKSQSSSLLYLVVKDQVTISDLIEHISSTSNGLVAHLEEPKKDHNYTTKLPFYQLNWDLMH